MVMKVLKALVLLLTSPFLMSCSDIFGGNDNKGDTESIWDQRVWWIYNGSAQKGIKTILEDNVFLWKYDESGRLLSYSRIDESGEYVVCEAIKYNDRHLPDTIKYYQNDQLYGYHTVTRSFEYENQGRYCPYWDYYGGFDISSQGLVPGLSKITLTDTLYEDYFGVITYTFDKDVLTVQYTEHGMVYPEAPVIEYMFDYKGAYPYQGRHSERFENIFIGPITYLPNGAFDTYVEGKINPDTGAVTEKKTVTYDTSFPDRFLPSTVEYGNKITAYTYNEHGDVILSDGIEYSYIYDSRGNWIKGTGKWPGQEEFSFERVIEYY